MANPKKLTHENYTIAWICALPVEMAAAKAMLDDTHVSLPQHPRDGNTYTLGEIGGHNVAVACLPSGVYGITSAGIVANQMLFTYTAIRFGLMVGIGGGAPTEAADIRLGDVVVSKPTGTLGGVVQFDLGKTLSNGRFERTGTLNKPPQVVLTALSSLQADDLMGASRVPAVLSDMVSKYPAMGSKFTHPRQQQDMLFEAGYEHVDSRSNCDYCDKNKLIERNKRMRDDPVIHYGLIASSTRVMRDGVVRDRLAQELDVLCFEMEAASLMDNFPSVVVRGIADYADSHKNKHWQEYAAAVAAAYAKCLISATSIVQTSKTQTVIQATSHLGARMAHSVARSPFPPNTLGQRGQAVQSQPVTSVVESQLASYFWPIRERYNDRDFDAIATLLGLTGSDQTQPYVRTPRLYTLLRHLETLEDTRRSGKNVASKLCPDYLDAFLENGLSDRSLPFSQTHLPVDPSEGWKTRFLEAQHIVCDSSDLIQMMCLGKHMTFAKSSPDNYFIRQKRIAATERSEVDKIVCVLGETEPYARKRFFKRVMTGDNSSIARSFENEIENLKRIVNHHCVKLVASYTDHSSFALIMSPVARYNLSDYLKEVTSSDDDLASYLPNFLGCLSRTLWFIHGQKLRHRDIKPENILVHDGKILLTDFDCSYSWAHTNRSTTTKAPPRTWKYASPEVARLGLQETGRIKSSSDIWSLGCVFLEIITVWLGRPLSELEESFGEDHYFQEPEKVEVWISRLREKASDLAKEALNWVEWMLQEPPDGRPSAHALVEESRKRHPWKFCCAECQQEDSKRIEPQTKVEATRGSVYPVGNGNEIPQHRGLASQTHTVPLIPEPALGFNNNPVVPTRSFSWEEYQADVCAEMDLAPESLREGHRAVIRASYAVHRRALLAAGFTESDARP
ncbi:Serine/threonine-protein kinase [Drechslerella dactyloides]|uniref:Serine/threonine-protein kinase n=1 Tax=Drechslerella dactyloides TaxID=74499 RepID=A0AAD6ITY6_DREDA|nr:Serine/threonine-protein kinase [Drechslerella dactyloides]